jgi:NADH-quinone oxidoreductase subunit C
MSDQQPAEEVEEAEEATAAAEEPERVHGAPVEVSHGQTVLHVEAGGYHDLLAALHADGFSLCVDLTAVDQLTNNNRPLPEGITPERFEVVVSLLHMAERRRVRVRCQVPARACTLPSITDLWPGADAAEREVYDMFGVQFEGHPDLSRILMPEDWEGHPLRKDYAIGAIPVQFKAAPGPR